MRSQHAWYTQWLLMQPRIVKIFELAFLLELTPLPSLALRLAFCTPLTHTQRHYFREASLRHALTQYVEHFHHERNHQGKGIVLLLPTVSPDTARQGPIRCHERLGGLLKYYACEAAGV